MNDQQFCNDTCVEITRHLRKELGDPTLSTEYCVGQFERLCWDGFTFAEKFEFVWLSLWLLPRQLSCDEGREMLRGFFNLRRAKRWLQ